MKSASSTALFAALGLIALGAGAPAAKAADLGGDCCADLEERVAELEATTARKGNRKVSLTISGQVTTSVMAWSDGNKFAENPTAGFILTGKGHDTYIVDNVAAGGTYFALTGDAKISPNLSAGFNITIAMDTGGRSHQVSQFDDDGTNTIAGGIIPTGPRSTGGFDTDIVLTLANWYLDQKQLGRVTVGRINTATAGITTIDLGGAGVIANAQIGYWQRGMFLTAGDVAAVDAGTTWANALGGNTVNGSSLSRANAISYTSPTFGGFQVSTAAGEDDMWDAALRYAGEFSGFRIAAGIGYSHNASGLGDISESFSNLGAAQDLAKPNQWKGSASILHVASGLFLTGAFVDQDNDAPVVGLDDHTRLVYVQGGITKNWTGLGNTVVYGEYAKVSDARVNFVNFGLPTLNADSRVWGIGIVQNVDAAAMELYLAYRRYSTDVPVLGAAFGTDFNDFDVVMGGARIKF